MASPKSQGAGHGELEGHPYRKVMAIVRTTLLDKVEQRLQEIHVPGISVTKVKGWGEQTNLFRADWTVTHARIEIFVLRERADEVAQAIVHAARTGGPGDGLVVVLPVEAVYQIRTGTLATSGELGGSSAARGAK